MADMSSALARMKLTQNQPLRGLGHFCHEKRPPRSAAAKHYRSSVRVIKKIALDEGRELSCLGVLKDRV